MQPELNSSIAQIGFKTDQRRKASFLNWLVLGILALHLVALLIILLVEPLFLFWSTMGASLGLNIIVYILNQRGATQLAAHIFCYTFNLLITFYIFENLFLEHDVQNAAAMSYLLSLSVLLAGLLVSPRATFYFAAIDAVLILVPFTLYLKQFSNALLIAFPIIVFMCLIAIVSWLYQTTLNRAFARASTAQQQLLQAQLAQRELEIARDLQQRLYPAPPPIGPQLQIASRAKSALETSGDFYDFIPLGPDEWGVVVADVTGKSVAAALVMAMTRSTLRSMAGRFRSPAAVLTQANQILSADTSVDQLITTFYGILNSRTLTLHFANAGHLPPNLKRDSQVEDLELPGLPLKAMPNTQYRDQQVQLCPGDQLILSTDGIVEAMNSNREMFGFERLAETIRRVKASHPQQILQEIWQTVETFRGEAQQEDDMALIIICVGDKAAPPVESS